MKTPGKPRRGRSSSFAGAHDWAALAEKSYAVGLKVLRAAEPKTKDRGWDAKTPGARKGFIAAIRYAVENAKRPNVLLTDKTLATRAPESKL